MENPEVVEIDALHQAHEAHVCRSQRILNRRYILLLAVFSSFTNRMALFQAVLGIRLRPITSACPALDGFNEKESAPPFK